MQNLDWDDLRIFMTAARSGSLARSARALGVDHSTVSRRLTRLEYAMGVALLERGRDGVKLTEAGVAVLRRAEELAASIVNLRADMGGAAAGGSVRLATMEGIASLWLTPRLETLRQQAPDIRLELVTSPTQVRVTRREADLFLSFFRPPGRALISKQLGAFATQLWAAPDYLQRRGTPAAPAALVEHDFVGYIDELVQVEAVRWLEELVSDPRLVFTSNSMIAQMGAARGGLGIVCLPSFAGAARAGLLPVLHGVVEGSREVWLSVHADLARAPRIKTVTAVLRDLIAADAAFLTD
jgi:DNA-binding transcriptional LysR family regulator